MLNNLFTGIFDTAGAAVFSGGQLLLCSLLWCHFRSRDSSHGLTLIIAAIRQALQ